MTSFSIENLQDGMYLVNIENSEGKAIVAALKDEPAQRDLATLLDAWDGVDRAEQAAPLVYQALYRQIALATFTSKLGEELARDMLST